MIEITRHVKVNILTIILFSMCSFFHYPVIFYVSYAVMTLHEAAHIIAAKCLGCEIDCVILQPFGVNMRLGNRLIPSAAEEIILYLSGPLVNAFAAFFAALVYIKSGVYFVKLFSMTNLALFAVNLLPALPLDGGYIARRALTFFFGYKRANAVMNILSALICAALGSLGVYAAYMSRNFSVLLFASLLFGNLLARREKYNAEYISAVALEHIDRRL